MTIFDTIRYPISDSPTRTQLEALPDEIMARWKATRAFQQNREVKIDDIVFFFSYYSSHICAALYIKDLRRIIAEYENDNI